MINKDSLTLKWGTLKEWDFSNNERGRQLLREYIDIGATTSVMLQKDTPRQKEIICELIDICTGEIWNDWENKIMTKEEAKDYVVNYGKKKE